MERGFTGLPVSYNHDILYAVYIDQNSYLVEIKLCKIWRKTSIQDVIKLCHL